MTTFQRGDLVAPALAGGKYAHVRYVVTAIDQDGDGKLRAARTVAHADGIPVLVIDLRSAADLLTLVRPHGKRATAAEPRPGPASPPLTKSQIETLTELAASSEPRTAGTLDSGPLSYHGLIYSTRATGFPLWAVSRRGRGWLAAHAAHQADRDRS